ncbi:ABC transporter ATP-binding protein [Gordonia sp. (in: high G+C Gram-positive bacteria)]|uniref:ABC transporter ATP-binding protein n=1 Tax=Gordonia sp. (in: high G+C Gram-positive bacteria) TaxID=84139 RepID=UPI002612146A|nr:ABC transporter ATP-binding protein [Gordonia sp. (in: high G+C Gram-positive bacteria)]
MTGTTSPALPIRLEDVGYAVGEARLLTGITATAPAGGFTGLIGPNGSGKTTLLSTIARWTRPDTGRVLLGDRPVRSYPHRELARVVAAVEQHSATETELTVEQVVDLGTIPHAGSRFRRVDTRELVDDALARLGIEELRTRTWQSLSGGERQKTQIARALVQQPRVLLLDEPTNHLDTSASLDVLTLLRSLPITTVAALHDLQLAAMYCDHLIVLDDGLLVTEGPPAQVLTRELLADVYRLDVEITPHPRTGAPMVVLCGTIGGPGRGTR